ncbi:DUF4097 family beta strand repeat-containing protein [Amphibacillus sp. Q70]|uniref:DUF4097 family beta strand repeat-containing protein n=1 Tax=Amphibacillus sp. Q70 TaxID=3453416 RepID=UPI003F845219
MSDPFSRKSDQSRSNQKIEQRETIDVARVKQLDVLTSNTDICIMIHDDPVIDVVLETYERGPELTINHSGEMLEIMVEKSFERRFFSLFQASCKLQISVPPAVVEKWNLQSGSGDISIANLIVNTIDIKSSSGDLDITEIQANKACFIATSGDITAENNKIDQLCFETSSGDVKLRTIYGDITGEASSGEIILINQQGEQLELKATSGDIHLENSVVNHAKLNTTSGEIIAKHFITTNVSVRSTSGDLEVQGFSGELKGKTTSGDIKLQPMDRFNLDLSTSSGDVNISCSKDVSAIFDAKTNSGDFSVNYPIEVHRHTENEYSGVIGDGANPINVKTSSGDVMLS